MRHMTKWNNLLLLDANCQRLAVSHRKIGCGSTCVEVAPMHPSLEPSLPVLVVPGMKDLRTNEFLYVLICLKTQGHDSRILYPDGAAAAPTNDNSCWG